MTERIWMRNEWLNVIAWALAIGVASAIWFVITAIDDGELGQTLALGLALMAMLGVLRLWHVHVTRRRPKH